MLDMESRISFGLLAAAGIFVTPDKAPSTLKRMVFRTYDRTLEAPRTAPGPASASPRTIWFPPPSSVPEIPGVPTYVPVRSEVPSSITTSVTEYTETPLAQITSITQDGFGIYTNSSTSKNTSINSSNLTGSEVAVWLANDAADKPVYPSQYVASAVIIALVCLVLLYGLIFRYVLPSVRLHGLGKLTAKHQKELDDHDKCQAETNRALDETLEKLQRYYQYNKRITITNRDLQASFASRNERILQLEESSEIKSENISKLTMQDYRYRVRIEALEGLLANEEAKVADQHSTILAHGHDLEQQSTQARDAIDAMGKRVEAMVWVAFANIAGKNKAEQDLVRARAALGNLENKAKETARMTFSTILTNADIMPSSSVQAPSGSDGGELAIMSPRVIADIPPSSTFPADQVKDLEQKVADLEKACQDLSKKQEEAGVTYTQKLEKKEKEVNDGTLKIMVMEAKLRALGGHKPLEHMQGIMAPLEKHDDPETVAGRPKMALKVSRGISTPRNSADNSPRGAPAAATLGGAEKPVASPKLTGSAIPSAADCLRNGLSDALARAGCGEAKETVQPLPVQAPEFKPQIKLPPTQMPVMPPVPGTPAPSYHGVSEKTVTTTPSPQDTLAKNQADRARQKRTAIEWG